MRKKLIHCLSAISVFSLIGCTINNNKTCDFLNRKDVVESINKSHEVESQYSNVKNKILFHQELSSEDKTIIDDFLWGIVIESFDRYKEEIDYLYKNKCCIDVLVESSMLMIYGGPQPGYEKCLPELVEKKNFKWMIQHLESIKDEVINSSSDEDPYQSKINLCTSLSYLYNRIGDIEKRNYYKSLHDEYMKPLID